MLVERSLLNGQRQMGISNIEKAWRRGWMRSIGMLSAGEHVATLPAWSGRPHTALYMRTQEIGDVILATGVLRAIAEARPTLALDVLTTAQAAPVLEGNPHIRRVHVLPRGARAALGIAQTLRRARYDVIIDGKITRGASFIRSPALSMIARAPYRVGVGGGNHDLVFNVCVDPFDRTSTHMVDGSAALATPFGADISSADMRPKLFLSAAERESANREWIAASGINGDRGDRWLVNISAGAPLRRWPNDRWSALIVHLLMRRPMDTVIVIGSAKDWASVCDVAYWGGAVAVKTEQLRSALALVGTSTRVVTVDTSITHAATAFCKPTVVLIQRGLTQWLPWRTPHRVAYWSGATINSLGVGAACVALDGLLESSHVAAG